MAIFIYKATDLKGRTVKGEIVAMDKEEVVAVLSRKNLIPSNIKLKSEKKAISAILSTPLFGRITILDKARFTERLAALIKAGLSISGALDILVEGAENITLKRFLSQLKTDLEKGQPLHITFSQYPKHFSPVFISLIKAGEISGNLEKILNEIAINYRKEYDLRRRIISASMYPLILLTAAVLIVIFMIIFIIPRMVSAYAGAAVKLPAFTQFFISLSNFVQKYYLFVLGALLIIVLALALFKKTKTGKLFFAKIKLSLPVFGGLERKVMLSQFCRTISMLLASGITLTEGLEVGSDAMSNEAYKRLVMENKKMVEKGIPLSDCLKNYPKYFPPLLTGTMVVGEQTGKLDEMLNTLNIFYEDEIERTLETLTTSLEPILLVIMGGIIAFIALSLLVPIYQYISTIV